MTDLSTQDIRPAWMKVLRRLQSVSCMNNSGAMIVTISIVVDQNGNPRFWLEPQTRKIEPAKAMEEFMSLVNKSL